MNLAVVGPGAIGSTVAFHLARAGHRITVVARGQRLAQLQEAQAIVTVNDERAPVEVAPALDPSIPYDLVLVTVLAPQVEAVLPSLTASAAKTVMFMFNTFEPLDRLRAAVGEARFAFGFPGGILAQLVEGRLKKQVLPGTTMSDASWAKVFRAAGIPTGTHPDMHTWLRCHAAFVTPLMVLAHRVHTSGRGLTWAEVEPVARAWVEAFDVVRGLGHALTPSYVWLFGQLPQGVVTAAFWVASRTGNIRDLGTLGPGEARMLIDSMTAAAPGRTAALLAARP